MMMETERTRYQLGKNNREEYRSAHQRAEKDPLSEIRGMALIAAERMEKILNDDETPDRAKLMLIDMILNRTYGSPEACMKIRNDEESIKKSRERLAALVERIKREEKEKN